VKHLLAILAALVIVCILSACAQGGDTPPSDSSSITIPDVGPEITPTPVLVHTYKVIVYGTTSYASEIYTNIGDADQHSTPWIVPSFSGVYDATFFGRSLYVMFLNNGTGSLTVNILRDSILVESTVLAPGSPQAFLRQDI
jgi:hypothetical protein